MAQNLIERLKAAMSPRARVADTATLLEDLKAEQMRLTASPRPSTRSRLARGLLPIASEPPCGMSRLASWARGGRTIGTI